MLNLENSDKKLDGRVNVGFWRFGQKLPCDTQKKIAKLTAFAKRKISNNKRVLAYHLEAPFENQKKI